MLLLRRRPPAAGGRRTATLRKRVPPALFADTAAAAAVSTPVPPLLPPPRAGLHLHLQTALFDWFKAEMDAVVRRAKEEGKYDRGLQEISTHAPHVTVLRETVIARHVKTGAEAKLLTLRVRGLLLPSIAALLLISTMSDDARACVVAEATAAAR